eukprot:scaffold624_cov402-Prasinococcus_capsulatus_cf.AAC.71
MSNAHCWVLNVWSHHPSPRWCSTPRLAAAHLSGSYPSTSAASRSHAGSGGAGSKKLGQPACSGGVRVGSGLTPLGGVGASLWASEPDPASDDEGTLRSLGRPAHSPRAMASVAQAARKRATRRAL